MCERSKCQYEKEKMPMTRISFLSSNVFCPLNVTAGLLIHNQTAPRRSCFKIWKRLKFCCLVKCVFIQQQNFRRVQMKSISRKLKLTRAEILEIIAIV